MITIAQVNKQIAPLGIELIRGEGYFYFISLELGHQIFDSVYVNSLNQLTLEQWDAEAWAAFLNFAEDLESRGTPKIVTDYIPKLNLPRTFKIHHLGFRPKGEPVATKTFMITDDTILGTTSIARLAFEKDNAPFFVKGAVLTAYTGRPYSMSMGDVLEVDGKFAYCEAMGWSEITTESFNKLLHERD